MPAVSVRCSDPSGSPTASATALPAFPPAASIGFHGQRTATRVDHIEFYLSCCGHAGLEQDRAPAMHRQLHLHGWSVATGLPVVAIGTVRTVRSIASRRGIVRID
jgi:hypothetical protein